MENMLIFILFLSGREYRLLFYFFPAEQAVREERFMYIGERLNVEESSVYSLTVYKRSIIEDYYTLIDHFMVTILIEI